MSTGFWHHTIWYLLLLFTSIISTVLTFYKYPNRRFMAAYFCCVLGLTVVLEASITLFSPAYRYIPKVVADRFQDAVIGSYFSQLSLTSTALLLVTWNLSVKWYVLFPVIYFFIEELFIKLGIYHHYWYQTIYSLIGLTLLFWVVKKWYKALMNSPKYYLYYFALFCGVYAIYSLTVIMSLKLLTVQVFRANIFQEYSRNHTFLNSFYSLILINVLLNLYHSKRSWIFKGFIWLGLLGIQLILYKTGVLYIAKGWLVPVIILDLLGCYLWIVLLDRLLRTEIQVKPILS